MQLRSECVRVRRKRTHHTHCADPSQVSLDGDEEPHCLLLICVQKVYPQSPDRTGGALAYMHARSGDPALARLSGIGEYKFAFKNFFRIQIGDGRLECQGSAYGYTVSALTLGERDPGVQHAESAWQVFSHHICI